MRQNYPEALKAVLHHEGGYVNHPKDPGGETNKGVTKAVYDEWRRANGLKVQSVKKISDAEIEAIYRKGYWDVCRCDELPSGVDYCVFDFAVNSGTARAAKFLQMTVGAKPDGVIGPDTVKRTGDIPARAVITEMCERRMTFLRGLGTWGTFGKGWSSRVTGVKALAIDMIGRTAPEKPVEPVPVPPAPDVPAPAPKPSGGLLALILRLIAALFGTKSAP